MITLIRFAGSDSEVLKLCCDREAAGAEVVSISSSGPGVFGCDNRFEYLITLRSQERPAPLGSNLLKGLRLAVARLSSVREMGAYEMSSLWALADGRESVHDMDIIEGALSRLGK